MKFGKELKLKRLLKEENLFLPDYSSSISLVADTVEGVFLGKQQGLGFKLPKSKKVVVLFIDSVGFGTLKDFDKTFKPKVLRNGFCHCISSVAPTTTTLCGACISTGSTASDSGFLLHRLYLEEKRSVFDLLHFRKIFPEIKELSSEETTELIGLFSFKPTIFARLEKKGIECFSVIPKQIEKSGLRRITDGNVKILTFEAPSELVIKMRNTLKQKKSFFSMVYWPYPDEVSHHLGNEQEMFLDLHLFFQAIEWLSNELKDCLFIIISDHGRIKLDKMLYSNDDSELNSLLVVPPFGDCRLANFKAKPGKEKELFDYLSKAYGKNFLILTAKQVLDLRIYGPEAKHPERIGDFVLIPRKPMGLYFSPRGDKKKFIGMHSGLTKDELLVPFGYFKT